MYPAYEEAPEEGRVVHMRKGLLFLTVLFVMLASGFCGLDLMEVMAEEKENIHYNKYYTSICLEQGDTLWNIAERYSEHSGKSVAEYVRELRDMNSLSDDRIHAGHYLTITYYEPERENH